VLGSPSPGCASGLVKSWKVEGTTLEILGLFTPNHAGSCDDAALSCETGQHPVPAPSGVRGGGRGRYLGVTEPREPAGKLPALGKKAPSELSSALGTLPCRFATSGRLLWGQTQPWRNAYWENWGGRTTPRAGSQGTGAPAPMKKSHRAAV